MGVEAGDIFTLEKVSVESDFSFSQSFASPRRRALGVLRLDEAEFARIRSVGVRLLRLFGLRILRLDALPGGEARTPFLGVRVLRLDGEEIFGTEIDFRLFVVFTFIKTVLQKSTYSALA